MKNTYLSGILLSLFTGLIQPVYSQIIISEIFADPSPSRGLPEKEFIEIYNGGNQSVSLKGYIFIYSTSKSTFPDSQILPHEYLIICKKGNEADYQQYGKVIPLSGFSLLNEGTLLILQDQKGNDVFSVKYSSSWYSAGKDQGFSLEMIDKNYACKGKENWASSVSDKGATPGIVNSVDAVIPDVKGPDILNHYLEGQVLTLEFNEKLNPITATSLQNFIVDVESIQIAGISADPYENEFVRVKFSRFPEENEIFELSVSKIEDCSGNVMEPVTLKIGNFLPPDSSEILLSEVLFNPRIGGYDFVELFNNSEKSINLKDWILAKRDAKGALEGLSLIRNRDLIIGPGEYLAITENRDVLLSQYPGSKPSNILEIPSVPSLPVSSGTIVLMDGKHKIFDEFSYFEDMHHPLLDDRKGVSLERISFDVTSSSIKNWKSSSFSGHFSTPGYKNSQNDTNLSQVNIFYAEPVVFFPYSKVGPDRTTLKFSITEPGTVMTVKVLDTRGRVVRNLVNNDLTGANGTIFWDGTDNSGGILPTGYYLFYIEVNSSGTSETYLVKTVSGAY